MEFFPTRVLARVINFPHKGKIKNIYRLTTIHMTGV